MSIHCCILAVSCRGGGGGAPNPIFLSRAKKILVTSLLTFELNHIKQHIYLVLLIRLNTHKSFSLVKWRLDFIQKYSIQFNFYEKSINSLNTILFHINKPLFDICSQKTMFNVWQAVMISSDSTKQRVYEWHRCWRVRTYCGLARAQELSSLCRCLTFLLRPPRYLLPCKSQVGPNVS